MAYLTSLESFPILQLDQVTRQFSRSVSPAVDAVSLVLRQGELLSLLGPSGCGKTTLLRLIAGFEQPQNGTIEIAHQKVVGAGCWVPPEQRGVGMVFQDYALFPHLTVQQNVAFGLTAGSNLKKTAKTPKNNSAALKQRVREAIALVGLEGLETRYPHQLSGGQQQRIALARALAPHPFLVLLDEPLSNLDVQVRLRLRQELREILKAAGTSAIFVTHDQEEALSISDQVAVMQAGQIEQIGTPETLYQKPASRFVASFVTQANFLPAHRRGQLWETEIGCFAIEQTIACDAALDLNTLDQAELMIRQEDIILKPQQGDWVVRDRQFLGREYRYSLQMPSGRQLIARTPASTPLAIGTPVQISVPAAALRVFPKG